jgi:2-isopropylmalate synthase
MKLRPSLSKGTQYIVSQLDKLKGTEVIYQYSPESYTGTELDYSLEFCEAVMEAWEPAKRGKIILNLPADG